MPAIRDYPEAETLEPTDAVVIDRLNVGTMYAEVSLFGGSGSTARCITYVIDGGGSELSTGVVGDLYLPFAVTLSSATLLADQTGSVVVDIWSDAYANYPPTVEDSITGATSPTISAADKAQDDSLSDWVTVVPAGSTLRFNIDSVSTITRLTVALGTV